MSNPSVHGQEGIEDSEPHIIPSKLGAVADHSGVGDKEPHESGSELDKVHHGAIGGQNDQIIRSVSVDPDVLGILATLHGLLLGLLVLELEVDLGVQLDSHGECKYTDVAEDDLGVLLEERLVLQDGSHCLSGLGGEREISFKVCAVFFLSRKAKRERNEIREHFASRNPVLCPVCSES